MPKYRTRRETPQSLERPIDHHSGDHDPLGGTALDCCDDLHNLIVDLPEPHEIVRDIIGGSERMDLRHCVEQLLIEAGDDGYFVLRVD